MGKRSDDKGADEPSEASYVVGVLSSLASFVLDSLFLAFSEVVRVSVHVVDE
jgi:hypothetical protein